MSTFTEPNIVGVVLKAESLRLFGRNGFTLIEMMITVAALVILLGLMVSLARDVRNRSANELTADVLSRLDHLVGQYASKYGGHFPDVEPVIAAVSLAPTEDGV